MPGKEPGIDEQSFYWLMFAPPPDGITFEGGKSIRKIPPSAIEQVLQLADQHLPPFFQNIIQASVAEHNPNLWIHPIVDQSPDTLIHPSHRILLMGDAAATLRPHTASGTVKAFADAMVMGKLASNQENPPTIAEFCQAYNQERVAEGQSLVKLGQHLGQCQILNPPDWTTMSHEDYDAWWTAMLSGTNFAYKAPTPSNDNDTPSSSSTSDTTTTDSDSPQPPPQQQRKRRRKRHNFDLQAVPSFAAFQQEQSIRTLYRQFMRLAYRRQDKDDDNSNKRKHDDLVLQIRREFRHVSISTNDDPWATKRALSEGHRRYKELTAMLSSVPGGTKGSGRDSNASSSTLDEDNVSSIPRKEPSSSPVWPWNAKK
jgi:hypothetical protein